MRFEFSLFGIVTHIILVFIVWRLRMQVVTEREDELFPASHIAAGRFCASILVRAISLRGLSFLDTYPVVGDVSDVLVAIPHSLRDRMFCFVVFFTDTHNALP